jgi:hypothetical protein
MVNWFEFCRDTPLCVDRCHCVLHSCSLVKKCDPIRMQRSRHKIRCSLCATRIFRIVASLTAIERSLDVACHLVGGMKEVPEQPALQPMHVCVESANLSRAFEVPRIVSMSRDDDLPYLSSVSFDDDDDDDGHVSSLHSNNHGCIQQERRVLFGEYWKASKGKPNTYSKAMMVATDTCRVVHPADTIMISGEREVVTEPGYSSILVTPTSDGRDATQEHGRRKIFCFATTTTVNPSSVSFSLQSRVLYHNLEKGAAAAAAAAAAASCVSGSACSYPQKASSSSCLRNSRFGSGIVGRRRESSDSMSDAVSVVSFSPMVKVVIYDTTTPMDYYWASDEGWVEFFA